MASPLLRNRILKLAGLAFVCWACKNIGGLDLPMSMHNLDFKQPKAAAPVPFNVYSEPSKKTNRTRRLELVHVTKTGGTAMEQSAKQTGLRWGSEHYIRKHDPYYHGKGQVTPPPSVTDRKYDAELWHTPPHWISPNILKDADTFIVVRNPYTRYVSEYFCPFYRRKGNKRPDNPREMNQWIQKIIHDNLDKAQNGHMLPIHYYIWDEQDNHTRKIDHVLKYEDRLPERFHMLMNDYGLDNITLMTKSRESNFNARNTTALDLSDETIRIINDYARKDFQLLGYPMVSTAAELRVVLLAQSSQLGQ